MPGLEQTAVLEPPAAGADAEDAAPVPPAQPPPERNAPHRERRRRPWRIAVAMSVVERLRAGEGSQDAG